ncbi:hypothetical protein INR49_027691, partial [Caranx melampygus]
MTEAELISLISESRKVIHSSLFVKVPESVVVSELVQLHDFILHAYSFHCAGQKWARNWPN